VRLESVHFCKVQALESKSAQVCSIKALLRLYYGSITALFGLHSGSIKALLRLY
jgi:hypothetical protein